MVDLRGVEQALVNRAVLRGDTAAQETARQMSANAPRGLTGRLAQAPKVTRTVAGTRLSWKVSVDVKSPEGYPYDVAQEEGTGVYVGKGRIYPRRARRLVFYWRKVGRVVAFRSVKGTPPTRFFSKAIRDWPARLRDTEGLR
jgi:hypothetical protein